MGSAVNILPHGAWRKFSHIPTVNPARWDTETLKMVPSLLAIETAMSNLSASPILSEFLHVYFKLAQVYSQ